MKIFINEKEYEEKEGVTLFKVVKKYKADSDVIVVNSFQEKKDRELMPNDRITLIKKGENLNKEEIEKLMISRSNMEVVKDLQKSTIGIAGVGGLGSTIAIALARTFVKKLVIADYDVVEPSNLNRQQYFINDLGKLKTEAIKSHIEAINPFIEIEIKNIYLKKSNVIDTFKECDIVIEAFDNAKNKAMLINELLLNSNSVVISGNGMAGYFSSNSIKTKRVSSRFYICGDGVSEAKEKSGLMAPRVLIVAGHIANTVIRIITGEINKGEDYNE